MNGNQIIDMIVRIIMRKAINGGISAGMKRMSGGRSQPPAPKAQQPAQHQPQPAQTAQPVQPPRPNEDRIQAKLAAKRAARAAQGNTNE